MEEVTRDYGEAYYSGNRQDGDRPALKLFTRLARRFLAPGQVLDFGCGPGFFLVHLQRHFRAIGVEQSPWANSAAQRRTGLPIHTSLAAVPSSSLDGLVSIHVVEHIEDPALVEILSEWRRVLKPGARALVVTPDAHGMAHRQKGAAWIAFTDPTHINLKGAEEWKATFADAGFSTNRSFADGLWDFPYFFRWLGRFEVLLLGWPTLIQFILARPLLPEGSGESVILIVERGTEP